MKTEYIQLTLESHKFELSGSTYMRISSIVSGTMLHNSWMVDSVDAGELQRWEASFKLYVYFQLHSRSVLLTSMLFMGQLCVCVCV